MGDDYNMLIHLRVQKEMRPSCMKQPGKGRLACLLVGVNEIVSVEVLS